MFGELCSPFFYLSDMCFSEVITKCDCVRQIFRLETGGEEL